MRRELAAGMVAGAAGTVALNGATFFDMLARGRPASGLPAEAGGRLGELAGLDLGDGATGDARREALGALLGLATGLGVGACYGLIRSWVGVPRPFAALGLAAAAMAGSDLPMTVLGLADPTDWDASSWAADLVPHLAYGVVAAAAYEGLVGKREPR